MRRTLCLAVLLLVVLPPTAASARVNPQVAGLQVALRAYGLYLGPIDGLAGPATVRGVRRFQQRVGLHVDGRAGPATRRAFGPLGRPLFGARTLKRGAFGWDVSVLQFLLARRGEVVYLTIEPTGQWRLEGGANPLEGTLAAGRVQPFFAAPVTLVVSSLGSCAFDVRSAAATSAVALEPLTCEIGTP